ncbi:hypothetical protein P8C59_003554 [Phyllachora maydis]|uniref:Uncharacterized protein n=1 Tax=Phyllachora maydis TaxID=1825666 RepID=A0AAD9MBJ5_9PEZI|nr:hypothetical protein P8C59_003554 [Phyllachora maydis]
MPCFYQGYRGVAHPSAHARSKDASLIPDCAFDYDLVHFINLKPLSVDALKPADGKDNGVPTPRTSRGHLLAGLRTAPKSATIASFPNNPASPAAAAAGGAGAGAGSHHGQRSSIASYMYDNANLYAGPKTSMPRYGTGHHQQVHNQGMGYGQQYTVEQILAPPQLQLDEQSPEQVDPNMQAQLLLANAYLADQQQRLQQQLRTLQAAAHQFQNLNLHTQSPLNQAQMMQQSYVAMYQQQQQQQQLQALHTMIGGQPIYTLTDPVNGYQQNYQAQQQTSTPVVQRQLVPPYPQEDGFFHQNIAFYRHGGRAAQPRNPPSIDEYKDKPTAKHEGSKNFATRTRRSAIHNLVRAGQHRKEARSGSGSGSGTITPISEGAEEDVTVETSLMVDDNYSDSGRSGSGSLGGDHDEAACSLPSSRTSTGSWGAIGSDRPSSRQKNSTGPDGVDGADSSSDTETTPCRTAGSFASLLKDNIAAGHKDEVAQTERKAPMLVLSSVEKRKAI